MSLQYISIKTDPKIEKKIAKKAFARIEKNLINFKGPLSLNINNEFVELPISVINPLIELLNGLSKDNDTKDEILTTQKAADLLNVSRPFIVKLIEAKELPSFKVGRNRRIFKNDLLSYKEKSLRERKKILQKLVDEAQDLDIGY